LKNNALMFLPLISLLFPSIFLRFQFSHSQLINPWEQCLCNNIFVFTIQKNNQYDLRKSHLKLKNKRTKMTFS
jgi:hypothetical protein